MNENGKVLSSIFVGKGRQGTVLKLSPIYCVKIFYRTEDAHSESAAYRLTESSPFFPKMHMSGPQFIVLDYVPGIPLFQYLSENRNLPKTVTRQMLSAFREMKQIGFSRIDAALFHIFIDDQNRIKIIDLVHSLSKNYAIPLAFLKGMNRLGLSDTFWEQTKIIDPILYTQWKSNRLEG